MDLLGFEKEHFDDHTVYYNEDSKPGLIYLRDHLDPEETRVFFDQARIHGKADFEDKHEYNWTLKYNQNDGSFSLEKRN